MRALHRLEPLWWILFGAGGMAAAMVLPPLLFVMGFAFPLEWFGDPVESFFRMKAVFANPVGRVVLIAVVSLTFWHAAHHLRHFALDMGLARYEGRISVLVYAFALLGTAMSIIVVGAL